MGDVADVGKPGARVEVGHAATKKVMARSPNRTKSIVAHSEDSGSIGPDEFDAVIVSLVSSGSEAVTGAVGLFDRTGAPQCGHALASVETWPLHSWHTVSIHRTPLTDPRCFVPRYRTRTATCGPARPVYVGGALSGCAGFLDGTRPADARPSLGHGRCATPPAPVPRGIARQGTGAPPTYSFAEVVRAYVEESA